MTLEEAKTILIDVASRKWPHDRIETRLAIERLQAVTINEPSETGTEGSGSESGGGVSVEVGLL